MFWESGRSPWSHNVGKYWRSRNGSLGFTGESLGGCNNPTSTGNVQGGMGYGQTPLSSERSSRRASISARLGLPQSLLWDKLQQMGSPVPASPDSPRTPRNVSPQVGWLVVWVYVGNLVVRAGSESSEPQHAKPQGFCFLFFLLPRYFTDPWPRCKITLQTHLACKTRFTEAWAYLQPETLVT